MPAAIPLADFFADCPAMLFIADAGDPDGALLQRSEALGRFLGKGAGIGSKLTAILHQEDLAAFQADWSRLTEGAASVEIEIRLRTPDGSFQPVSLSAHRSAAGAQIHGSIVPSVATILDEARDTERALRDRIALMERQQEQVIRELATPIIEVWDKVLTVPMLGVVDSVRAAEMMDSLLTQVSRKGSRFAILDLTGVDAVDTSTASHILKLVQALKLLGAEGIITGIQPGVSQTMVALGVDMEQITTLAKLRDGLRLCMQRQREERLAAISVDKDK